MLALRTLADRLIGLSAFTGALALRRYGDKQDIANACLWLSSDAGSYVTGAIIDCDGGTVLGNASGNALGELGDQVAFGGE